MADRDSGLASATGDGQQAALTKAHAAVVAETRGLPVAGRSTPADAFRAARRHFLAGERLDMRGLATELGISRKTLYRWTGDRLRLLSDVMSEIAIHTVANEWQSARGRGAQKIVDTLTSYLELAGNAPSLRRFMENEPEFALRVIASEQGVQGRLVPFIADLIREEEAAGTFDSEVDPDTLAYAVVRLMESFLYNDTMTRLQPDPKRARAVLGLLFR